MNTTEQYLCTRHPAGTTQTPHFFWTPDHQKMQHLEDCTQSQKRCHRNHPRNTRTVRQCAVRPRFSTLRAGLMELVLFVCLKKLCKNCATVGACNIDARDAPTRAVLGGDPAQHEKIVPSYCTWKNITVTLPIPSYGPALGKYMFIWWPRYFYNK